MEKVRIAIAGLGRLGKIHANHLCGQIPGAEVTAACSIIDAELRYARETLGIRDVYRDYDEMIERGNFDAVAIVTASGVHCSQLTRALEAGKHVFCEKPLGVTVDECLRAAKVVQAHPDLVSSWVSCAGSIRPIDTRWRKFAVV